MHHKNVTCGILGRRHYLAAVLLTLFLLKRCRVGLGDIAHKFLIAPVCPCVLQSLIVILALLCLAGWVLWRGKETSLTTFRLLSVQGLNYEQIYGHCG